MYIYVLGINTIVYHEYDISTSMWTIEQSNFIMYLEKNIYMIEIIYFIITMASFI